MTRKPTIRTRPRAALSLAMGVGVALATLGDPRGASAGDLPGQLHCVFEVTRETVKLPPFVWPVKDEAEANPQHVAEARCDEPPVATSRETSTLRLRLGAGLFRVDERNEAAANTMVTYDFPSRRVTRVDLKAKTYRFDALHAIVAFRVNELLSRVACAAELPGVNDARPDGACDPKLRPLLRFFSRFTSETLFSLRLPRTAPPTTAPALQTPVIRTSALACELGAGWEFAHDGKVVVKFVPSEHALSPDVKKSLRHFLAYECSIHPEIRDRILESGRLPGLLSFGYTDVSGPIEKTVAMKLKHVATPAEVAEDACARSWGDFPPHFKQATDPNDPLDVVIRKLDRPRAPADREAMVASVDDAMKRGAFLDAYLAWCEYTARSGDTAEAVGDKIRGTRHPQLTAFTRNPAPSLAGLERKLKDYEALDRAGLAHGYMIDALRGALLNVLGRPEEADTCFLKALEANPSLVNVYVLLGNNLFHAFRMNEAWRCFDAARRLAPDSPFLADVKTLETRLETDFREEF